MNAVLRHRSPDRYPFVPSIYEHGAKVIGKAPVDVARSAENMAAASLASWETYRHDLVSVGLDIYNIEAEAFGCAVSAGEDESIPGIVSHPLASQVALDVEALEIPTPGPGNRLQLVADAAARVVGEIGDEVWVYGCMSGPFSQAAELRGFENLIGDMLDAPQRVHALLDRTTELSLQQARRLSETGSGVNIFESWATLPMISPDIFGTYVVPYNKRIISALREAYRTPPPAVIMGGDTAVLMDYFIACGTSLVVADYNTDFDFMRDRTRDRNMIVRGCADPKQIERGEWDKVGEAVTRLAEKARGMRNFVWGCGAVSYDTTRDHLLQFKELCFAAG